MMTTLLFAFVAICAAAEAQDVSLKGINAVQIDLSLLDGQGTGPCSEKVRARSFGLLEDPIRTETELRLRQAGLRIGAGPVLWMEISGCANTVNVKLALKEIAVVRGQRGIVLSWIGATDLISPDQSLVREQIREEVSKFVNKWLADNGK
jgi:hypothetical protein